jgi:hypothetical protein
VTEFEQTLLKEIASLPESRRADVLAFVRYLKLSLPGEEADIEKRFDKAIESIRARARKMNITEEDIEAEIRAVREENTRRS